MGNSWAFFIFFSRFMGLSREFNAVKNHNGFMNERKHHSRFNNVPIFTVCVSLMKRNILKS